MKKSGMLSKIFGFILLAAFIVFYLVTAIIDLISLAGAKTVDSYDMNISEDGISVEGNFYYLTKGPVFSMKHSMSYVIPLGTEYYFILYNDSLDKCIFVRANEDYAEDFYKEVTENEQNGTNAGAYLKGKVREIRPKIRYEIQDTIKDLANDGCHTLSNGTDYIYIDLTTKFQCILRLVTAVLFIIGTSIIIFYAKRNPEKQVNELSKVVPVIIVILLLVGVGSMMYTMTFIEL